MTEKQKILCLHGYRQNATKLSTQTGSLRKILKNVADLHFISAPHKIPDSEFAEGNEDDQRAWWFTRPTSFSSRDETDLDTGLSTSIKEITKYFEEHGPFQGLLGFSQGAALVGILCALKQRQELKLDFQFAIIVSGFKSRCTLHSKLYDQKINISSLHVIGEGDQVIPNEMSRDLADVFVNPVIMTHPGGHFVPGRSSLKKDYIDFITSQKPVL